MKKISTLFFLLSSFNTLIAFFAFRDISAPLIFMFLISIIGLPLSVVLWNLNYSKEKSEIEENDEINVVGLFSIGFDHK